MSFLKKRASLTAYCAIVSILTIILYNVPCLSHAVSKVSGSFNGVIIIASLIILLFLVNFLACNILMWLTRVFGRIIIGISFILNAVCIYFISTMDVMMDDTMMGNVFGSNMYEASGYFCWQAFLFVGILGLLPALYIFLRKIDFGPAKRFLGRAGAALGLILVIAFANMPNWPWIDKNSTILGSLVMPWSYTVNTFRYMNEQKQLNREEILLPDATVENEEKTAVVLVIGESGRRDHFSVYGYPRETSPVLNTTPGVKAYIAKSAATFTTAATKAILDHKPTDEFYEPLPNYLDRAGVDVTWRTSNWGEPTLHIDKYFRKADLKALYPEAYSDYDAILFEGLDSLITGSDRNKVLICIQVYITHGPDYNRGCPPEYQIFQPVCKTVEMADANHDELMNSYDNTIYYNDMLIGKAIGQLKGLEGWKTSLIFLSDHGESLGENKLYMHGVPMSLAPKEQYEIPFCIWSSDPSQEYKDIPEVTQYSVFHSVLHFLGISSPIYDESLNLYK